MKLRVRLGSALARSARQSLWHSHVSDHGLPRPGPCLICHTCKSGSKACLPVLRARGLWAGVTEPHRHTWKALASSIGWDLPLGSALCLNLWKPMACANQDYQQRHQKETITSRLWFLVSNCCQWVLQIWSVFRMNVGKTKRACQLQLTQLPECRDVLSVSPETSQCAGLMSCFWKQESAPLWLRLLVLVCSSGMQLFCKHFMCLLAFIGNSVKSCSW